MGLTLYPVLRKSSKLCLSSSEKNDTKCECQREEKLGGGDNKYKVTGICYPCVSKIPGSMGEKSLLLN